MSRTLEMVFKNSEDKSVKISLADARDNLTGQDVKVVMESIIANNVFLPGNAQLIEAHSATVVSVTRQELQLV